MLPLLCRVCGGEMRNTSFVTPPSTVERILLHLDLPHRPPRVTLAPALPRPIWTSNGRRPSTDLQIFDISESRVLVRTRGPLGEEVLEVYAIER